MSGHAASPGAAPELLDTLDALFDVLRSGRRAVLTAPPGTGKTTLVPLAMLSEPWLGSGRIVVLEPRRLATRAAARRMANLLGECVGETVGFQTRDERVMSRRTRVEVITEGVLTRRLQTDPELPGTALVVFDEFHERNLHSDLGLALALDAAEHVRPDLRILVMSATLDTASVARLIGTDTGAPVFAAGGVPHPISVRWVPLQRRDRLEPAIAGAIERALREEDGDVLAFLPGAREIARVAGLLTHLPSEGTDVRPLYGMLDGADQDAALAPSPAGRRRVVLATDIAESSLTVEGVRVVVDSGLAKVPRFDPRTGMTRLQTVPVSKASAEQRSGRAGRLGPGVCYRLWSKGEHATRRAHREAEIGQVDLAGFALELSAWGTPDPASLRFLEQPPPRRYRDAVELVTDLGGIDDRQQVTPAGRTMAALPVHPRLARMIIDGIAEGVGATACAIAALLEERDIIRGHPDEVPTDIGERLRILLTDDSCGWDVDHRTIRSVQRRIEDLCRRAGVPEGIVVPQAAGRVLGIAYPDRLATRRGQPGRYLLRSGAAAWMSPGDALAEATFVVAADLDGNRKQARIRLAAAIDRTLVELTWPHEVETRTTLEWDDARQAAVRRSVTVLGGLVLSERSQVAPPSKEVSLMVTQRIRARGITALPWDPSSRALLSRLRFLHRTFGDPWPDVGDRRLLDELDAWLAPQLGAATSWDDVAAFDLGVALRALVPAGHHRELDMLAPTHITTASGRRLVVDYGRSDQPMISVQAQELYGTTASPTVAAGTIPVLVELLSPARRPIQLTSDLAGFWAGSWQQVRKEMAGRYPKHDWPTDPGSTLHRR